jgi:uncharacterized protein YndB with AHSA1/START domain
VGVVTVYVPPTRIVLTWKAPDWDGATEVEVVKHDRAGDVLPTRSRTRMESGST